MTHPAVYLFAINELRLENFRSFRNARLALAAMTLLVGRNGSGKSNALDALDFIREALTEGLAVALRRRDGLAGTRCHGAPAGEPMGLAIHFSGACPGGNMLHGCYGIRIYGTDASKIEDIEESFTVFGRPDLSFSRRGDRLWPDSKVGRFPGRRAPAGQLALAQMPEETVTCATDFRTELEQMRVYRLELAELAKVQPLRGETLLAGDGSNLAEVWHQTQQSAPDEARRILSTLSVVCEGLVGVDAEQVGGHSFLHLRRTPDVATFTSSHASAGTLHALALLLAVGGPTSLVAIDELEDALHPSAIYGVLDAIAVRALQPLQDEDVGLTGESFFRPVILTTHASELLDHPAATAEGVRVLVWESGFSSVYRLSEATAAASRSLESLGDLMRHNALGLRPAPETWAGSIFTP